jgi:subtilisin family serine protease
MAAFILLMLGGTFSPAQQTPPLPTKRLVVKIKAPMVRQIENALPSASMELDDPARVLRPDWFHKFGVRKIKALYPELVRARKQTGLSESQLADRVRARFPRRANRVAPGVELPEISRTYILDVQSASDAALAQTVAALQADPEVEYAQREQLAQANFIPNDPYFSSTGSWGQSYADEYALHYIQCSNAWDTAIGQGIVVAVVDTGIDYNHPDIAGNIWMNTNEIPGNGIDDDGNGYIDDVRGWDFVGTSYQSPVPDNDPMDPNGHGTHVAGIIAATGNNSLGIIGVSWGVQVMAVRGLDNNGIGTDAELASAVTYAANNGADVINNSYGGKGFSQVLLDAVNYAHGLGAVLVASAGNDSARDEGYFPASYPNVITVAASSAHDGRTPYSNWGTKIDVAAPGDDILSLRAAGTSPGSIVGTNYMRLSGTSMAAPHVAGLAALILSEQPGLSSEQVRQIIRVSAQDLLPPGVDIYTGWGRINAAAALAVTNPLEAKIQGPIDGQVIAGPVSITGVAQGPNFSYYVLEYGSGDTPSSWTVFQQSTNSVSGGELGVFTPDQVPDGRYTIQLLAYDNAGRLFADHMSVTVDYLAITDPPVPTTPVLARELKAGFSLPISGTARGPSFSQFRIQWARGINPTNGWSNTGINLVNGGLNPITLGLLATWDTTTVTAGDYYTVQLLVDNAAGFTSTTSTLVYVETDLMTVNWPQSVANQPGTGSSALPALDASGAIRIVLVTPQYAGSTAPVELQSFAWDGSTSTNFPLQLGTYLQPAVADLDAQPGDDIIVGEEHSFRIFRPDFTSYSLPTETGEFQFSPVVINDLNNDGQPEIISLANAGNTAYLHAWKTNGQELTTNFPIALSNSNANLRTIEGTRFLTVDLDHDGRKEILAGEGVSASTWRLRQFNFDGSPGTWPDLTFSGYLFSLAAGDLDGDGSVDIAVSYVDSNSVGQVTLLSADGTVKPGWPIAVGSFVYPALAIVDMNRDGKYELLANGANKLYALNSDGTSFSNAFPISASGINNFVVGDLDGDGSPDILYVHGGSLTALRADGTVLKTWALQGANGSQPNGFGMPVLGDFNQDGHIDIAVWYGLQSGNSMLTLLTPNLGTGPQSLDWPVNRHDLHNTSVNLRATGAPTVNITSPLDGAILSGAVTVAASASDDQGVLGVQFQLDGADLGAEIASAPYMVSWDTRTVGNGLHTLSAIARDAQANITISTISVAVTNDFTPPTVVITSPTNGASVLGTITVAASASDNVGVVGVQFQLDGVNLGAEVPSAPYTVGWNTRTTGNGSHTLSAIARDAQTNIAISTISVVVTNDFTPPTVVITSPTNGASVSNSITVAASASDNVGVAGVQFLLNGTNLGAQVLAAPYSVSWNTKTVPNGTYSLAAVASDAAGNASTSAVVTVNVRNVININFQPANAPTFTNYLVDAGNVYGDRGNGYSYGWNLNDTANAFDRNSSLSQDQRYDTLIAMQTGGTFTWEIGVPNGTYSVHVVAGDPSNINSVYKINVEGVLTVNGTPKNNSRWKEGTSQVTVTDGRLTVSSATGASNNKICYIDITPLF